MTTLADLIADQLGDAGHTQYIDHAWFDLVDADPDALEGDPAALADRQLCLTRSTLLPELRSAGDLIHVPQGVTGLVIRALVAALRSMSDDLASTEESRNNAVALQRANLASHQEEIREQTSRHWEALTAARRAHAADVAAMDLVRRAARAGRKTMRITDLIRDEEP